jgi:predicted dehydrogenase
MSPTATSEPLSALIVGCGGIAGGYDEDRADGDVLTHAKAYGAHPAFRAAACVEPDPDRRRRFMERWGVPVGYAALEEVDEAFDVASLCTPTALHAAQLEVLLEMPVRLVWAEKPLTADLARSRTAVAAFAAAGKPMAVNYLRRWAPEMTALKAEIAAGRWGRLQQAVVWYGKGLLNNGSHAVDLLRFLFGPLTPLACGGAVADGREDDPTLDATLAIPDGAVVRLIGTDHREYGLFEFELMFAAGRVSLLDGGFTILRRPVADNPRFPGYRALVAGEARPTGLNRAMLGALDNIAAHLARAEPLLSDGASALAAQETCVALADLREAGT